VSNGLHDR